MWTVVGADAHTQLPGCAERTTGANVWITKDKGALYRQHAAAVTHFWTEFHLGAANTGLICRDGDESEESHEVESSEGLVRYIFRIHIDENGQTWATGRANDT